jgi:uncharacterized protein
MTTNHEVVHRWYEARGRGDLDEVRRLLHDDLRWHDPYPEPHGGDIVGADRVLEQVFGAAEETGATFRLHDLLANERHAVALVEWSATVAGETMHGREVAVFHVTDGRIAEVWFSPEEPDRYAEFFGGSG